MSVTVGGRGFRKKVKKKKKKNLDGDFPGGLLVENSPCNARDMGSIPSQGTKTPHAMEQLGLCNY